MAERSTQEAMAGDPVLAQAERHAQQVVDLLDSINLRWLRGAEAPRNWIKEARYVATLLVEDLQGSQTALSVVLDAPALRCGWVSHDRADHGGSGELMWALVADPSCAYFGGRRFTGWQRQRLDFRVAGLSSRAKPGGQPALRVQEPRARGRDGFVDIAARVASPAVAVDADVLAVVAAVEAARTPDAAWPPPTAPGWAHLPVALVDTTFSLGSRYGTDDATFPPVSRYAAWTQERLDLESGELLRSFVSGLPDRPHTVGEMLDLLGPLTPAQRVALFGTRRPANTRAGAPRRADTVLWLGRLLVEFGVDTTGDFIEVYEDDDARGLLRRLWLGVPGFGKRSWEYLPLLCGLDGVKADVHVVRFVGRAVGRGVSPEQARPLMVAATDELERREPGDGWRLGGVEHFVWRVASGRRPVSRSPTSSV